MSEPWKNRFLSGMLWWMKFVFCYHTLTQSVKIFGNIMDFNFFFFTNEAVEELRICRLFLAECG